MLVIEEPTLSGVGTIVPVAFHVLVYFGCQELQARVVPVFEVKREVPISGEDDLVTNCGYEKFHLDDSVGK